MSLYSNEKRENQPREMLMVSEYLNKSGLFAKSSTRVRLGNPHPELMNLEIDPADVGILRIYSRWADAVVFGQNEITIIEAKIKPQLGPLEALMVYERLFLADPTYKEHHSKKITKLFLYAIEDPVFLLLCRELGIKPVQFTYSGMEAYKKILRPRETVASRTNIADLSAP